MEIILILAAVGLAWYFLSGTHASMHRNPATLPEGDLEDVFIEVKRKVLGTSPYTSEKAYEAAYWRLRSLLAQILARHQHYVLDVEAKKPSLVGLLSMKTHHTAEGMSYTGISISSNIPFASTASEVLLYLAFYLWNGGQAGAHGPIEADPKKLKVILDYLIEERNYAPAKFLKGMAMKYGLQPFERGDLAQARKLLEAARAEGIGAAEIELRHLDKHRILESVPSVH